ncbi:magnesium-translocating P-type ATPase [Tatumella saanichensis]|uniref:magnesium-translocating P-type ATPase n=1 Tax=Tatumella saanichensis TaxID=480813 RepID=UPI0004A4CFCB|nr:magnesium-translocating P-type ATPase [Tatumella saanichensis]
MTQILNTRPYPHSAKPTEPSDRTGIARHIATSSETTLRQLNTCAEGLSTEEASHRLQCQGANQITPHKAPPALLQWLLAFHNPFIYVLLALACVSFITDFWLPFRAGKPTDLTSVTIMSCMVLFSTLLRFIQEYRTGKAAEALNALIEVTARVQRSDDAEEIQLLALPRQQLVPGDIVEISAGDMIPADLRLLESRNLLVNQSALTGETLPVEKQARLTAQSPVDEYGEHRLLNEPAIALMGTSVISGCARAVVVATGNQTWYGSLARQIAAAPPPTAFDKGVNSVSWLLIRFMGVMVPVVFVINGLTKGNWTDALFFSLAVAVGLTPEMLPMIVSTNLAKGAMALAARKVVVKRIHAIQNLGAMDVLCTDKTGTLTDDNMALVSTLNPQGEADSRVAELAWLNSYYQQGISNPMDRAVINYGRQQGMSRRLQHLRKADELPFDFTRRCLSVSVFNDQGCPYIICKGASEEMLARCSELRVSEATQPLTDVKRQHIRETVAGYNRQGYRVLLVATRILPVEQATRRLSQGDERELTLNGMLLFLDPVKPGAQAALTALKELGVAVKVLTGDNAEVSAKICQQLGLDTGTPLTGPQLAAMDDPQLKALLPQHSLFARLTPSDKTRLVTLMQQSGHTVGFLGDGINDAAALHHADVGISVENATQVARSAADIILLEKDLNVLEQGVRTGRQTFGNIIKYLNITASANFGNVFSVLIASAFLPFLPMLAIQLLLQNLIYDVSQMALPWDRMDDEFVAQPRKWDAGNIGRFMLVMGPLSSLFDVATFVIMWHLFADAGSSMASLFQSGWFVEGLLSQTLVVHMLRTRRIPFLQSCARWPVLVSTLLVVVIGIALPYSGLAHSIGLTPLPLDYFPWLLLILSSYCLLSQGTKQYYCRRFGQWF